MTPHLHCRGGSNRKRQSLGWVPSTPLKIPTEVSGNSRPPPAAGMFSQGGTMPPSLLLSQEAFHSRLLTLHFLLQFTERRSFSNHMVSAFTPQLLGCAQRPAKLHLSASFGHSGLLLRKPRSMKAHQRWNKAFTLSWAGGLPRSGAPNWNHCGLPSSYP